MARSKFRRAPRFENLETRELLSTIPSSQAPSNEAQYMLQVLNLARTNPQAAVQYIKSNITPDIQATLNYYGVDLNATLQEIASSDGAAPAGLERAARPVRRSRTARTWRPSGFQSHNGSDGSTPPQRIQAAGLHQSELLDGENVYAYAQSVDQAMEAFLLDWGVSDAGHRDNILQPGVSRSGRLSRRGHRHREYQQRAQRGRPDGRDPGLRRAAERARPRSWAWPTTTRRARAPIETGEGIGGITITAVNLATGQVSSTQTWASGGYELPLSPGQYLLIASQNNQVISSQTIDMNNVNVEQDFNVAVRAAGRIALRYDLRRPAADGPTGR